jgi:hypothetical protein
VRPQGGEGEWARGEKGSGERANGRVGVVGESASRRCRRCRRVGESTSRPVGVVDGAGSVDNGPKGQENIAQALAWVNSPPTVIAL